MSTGDSRTNSLTEYLDRQFAQLHAASSGLIRSASSQLLYSKPRLASRPLPSFGEQVLRSAAIIEQTFGGITVNLWDDPFEWTLPETLSTVEKIAAYLDEVERTRRNAFEFFKEDDDLLKEVMTPAGAIQLLSLLLDTLVRAVHYQGRAFATFDILREQDQTPAGEYRSTTE